MPQSIRVEAALKIAADETLHDRRRFPRLSVLADELLAEMYDDVRPARLTRNERLQGLADSGIDTWDEYEGRV